MIRTEKQRRWWFATHPEFSWGRLGISTGSLGKYGHLFDKNADDLDRWRRAVELDKKGLEPDPHTALDIMPYRRFVTSPIQAFRDLFRSKARDAILNATRPEKSKGPGDWVEVPRAPLGLEHQSKMSGQAIRESGGKSYIREYELNGVKFDDYKDGKLYEYKGPQGKLLNKEGEFYDWVRGSKAAQDQAARQVEAAAGIPVVWKVGPNQVKAYQEAIGKMPGLIIEP
ncbi:MAG: hypothetical protein HY912_12375 [Desulfomonile tiedjei]|uniref:Tox-REase-5 domain-containing protein n=1 Tax=Desulfomonile tiedjei TaxID=2358 RepID=A0A9D6V758_9BACT|nr:hypothetical protein [Desulfomonile tiedjei]